MSSTIKITILLAIAACSYAQKSEESIEQNLMQWMENQEVSLDLPYIGSKINLSARNLQEDELDVKVQLSSDSQARKSKLKKIFAPILILVILKAITLIPLALGVLGLKTWNAIQLAFVTFVISISLAVYEMCKKVAADNAPIVTHSAPWAGKSFADLGDAQELAYSSYYVQ